MSVVSDSPLSDMESIDLAIDSRFAGRQFQQPDGGIRYDELTEFIADYNNDSDYVQLVTDLYEASIY